MNDQKKDLCARNHTWLTGIFFQFIVFLRDDLDILRLSVPDALVLSILVFALSAVIYQAWLFRKDDVEGDLDITGVTVQTRIREYRAPLSLTQDDLAKRVGGSPGDDCLS
jgi:hypothetical protein